MERRTQAAAYAARSSATTSRASPGLTGRTGRLPPHGYCCSAAGRATPAAVPPPAAGSARRLPPSAPARSAQVGQAAAAPVRLDPVPLSWTTSTRSGRRPRGMARRHRPGWRRACRATFDRASRSTASRCSAASRRAPGVEPAVQAQRRARSRAARSSPRRRPRIWARHAGRLRPAVRLEARRSPTGCPDRVVQRVDRTAGPGRPTSGSSHQRRRPLQRHAGREQPLDDQVVQVAGDPVAVGEQRQLLRRRGGARPAPARCPPARRTSSTISTAAGRQRQRARPAAGGQHAADVAGRAQRDHHRRAQAQLLALATWRPARRR